MVEFRGRIVLKSAIIIQDVVFANFSFISVLFIQYIGPFFILEHCCQN